MKKFLPLFIFTVLAFGEVRATKYYFISGSLTTASNWNTSRTGGGVSASNFITPNDSFAIQSGQSPNNANAWMIGGAGTVLQIEPGATLTNAQALTFNAAAVFRIENGGTYIHSHTSSNPYSGIESFAPNSNFRIERFPSGLSITTNVTLPYGNLEFAMTTSNSGWNQNWTGAVNLCAGNFTIINLLAQPFTCTSTGIATVTVGGSFSIAQGTFDLAAGAGNCTMNIGGNFTQTGGTITATVGSGGFTFNKNGLQTFTRSGTGSIAAKTINFTVLGGSILDMGTSYIDNTTGNFLMNPGSHLRMGLPEGITNLPSLSGHVRNASPGTRTFSTGGYYTYNGSALQNTGNGLPSTVAGLTINNPAGLSLFNVETLITDSIGLLSGKIITDATHGITMSPSCIIKSDMNVYGDFNHGNQQSYISGPLKIQRNDNLIITLPIGKQTGQGSFYAPVRLTPTIASPKTFSAEYFPTYHPDFGNVDAGYIDHISTVEYWNISCDQAGSPYNNALVSLSWRPSSNVATTGGSASDSARAWDSLVVAHYLNNPSPIWSRDGAPTSSNDNIRVGSTLSYGYVTTRLNNAVYASFTLGSRSAIKILPVQILSWTARAKGQKVLLEWKTMHETNLLDYTLERSGDGRNFTAIAKIVSQNSDAEKVYTSIDGSPYSGMNYYRLLITDRGAKKSYTRTLAVYFKGSDALSVFPNPAHETIMAEHGKLAAGSNYGLYDQMGRQLAKGRIVDGAKQTLIPVSKFPAGPIILKIGEGKRQKVLQFVKQ